MTPLNLTIKEYFQSTLYHITWVQLSRPGIYWGIDKETWIPVAVRFGPLIRVMKPKL
jgi:hypothetical protein